MTTIQKIEKLNKKCDGSLSITHYPSGWEIYSFRIESPLSMDKHYPVFNKGKLIDVVNEAYKFVFEEK